MALIETGKGGGMMAKIFKFLSMLTLVLAVLALPAHGGEVAKVQLTPSQVHWDPQVSYERLVLTVSKPGGEVVRQEFAAGQAPVFELPRGEADGSYVYELRVVPPVDPAGRRALPASRESGHEAAVDRLKKAGRLPAGELVQSGSFMVVGGAVVAPDASEPRSAPVK